MAHLHRSAATLRISGDDLDPDEISNMLGCTPTASQRKGDVFTSQASGRSRTARFGLWRLEASDREPENFDAQIEELLGKLSAAIDVWRSIGGRYKMDLFCGLFMRDSNEGAQISATSLVALGERGIDVSLDIYSPTIEELKAQRTYWEVRSTLEVIAEMLTQHNEAPPKLRGLNFESEEELWAYLSSDELWGGAGSVADQALSGRPEARKQLERLLIRLGREQMSVGSVNVRTEMWVAAFEKWSSEGLRK